MTLSDLPPGFVDRLENWGRYYRPRGKPFESTTYRVCEEAAVAAGKTITDGYREANSRQEIDVDDALIMERHWAMSSYRLPAVDRALVKAHWVEGADPRMVCRLLKLRYLSYEKELCEATQRFRNVVAVLESTAYNRVNNLTPSMT